MKFIVCTIIILFSLSSSAKATWQQSVHKIIEKWQTENNVPGLSMVVSTPQHREIFLRGTSYKETNAPVTSLTKFGVGSITKTFISALILKLEEEGKLKIEDPMGLYIQEYPRWSHFTLKQLLQMSADIRDFYGSRTAYFNDVMTNPSANWTPDALLKLAYQMPERTEFIKWVYSNTNYLLLGKVIEKVTGHSLRKVLKSYILTPLGLKNTAFSENEFSISEKINMAHGYYNDIDMFKMKPSNYGAAGAVFMSVLDLEKWAKHLLVTQDVLSQKQLRKMLEGIEIPPGKVRPENTSFGLGVFITKDPAFGKMIWYTGAIQGHSSVFLWIPSRQVMIVAQINHWEGSNFKLLFPHKPLIQAVLKAVVQD
jgi:D-alanyl-D-alanine carboxypeptidase